MEMVGKKGGEVMPPNRKSLDMDLNRILGMFFEEDDTGSLVQMDSPPVILHGPENGQGPKKDIEQSKVIEKEWDGDTDGTESEGLPPKRKSFDIDLNRIPEVEEDKGWERMGSPPLIHHGSENGEGSKKDVEETSKGVEGQGGETNETKSEGMNNLCSSDEVSSGLGLLSLDARAQGEKPFAIKKRLVYMDKGSEEAKGEMAGEVKILGKEENGEEEAYEGKSGEQEKERQNEGEEEEKIGGGKQKPKMIFSNEENAQEVFGATNTITASVTKRCNHYDDEEQNMKAKDVGPPSATSKDDLYSMVKRRQTLEGTKPKRCNHYYRNGRRCKEMTDSRHFLCEKHQEMTRKRKLPMRKTHVLNHEVTTIGDDDSSEEEEAKEEGVVDRRKPKRSRSLHILYEESKLITNYRPPTDY